VKRPAVFLDRDGTLIEDCKYLHDPARVRILPGVADGLRRLRAAGFVCVVVTNQSGIGRGMFAEADYHRVHAEMLRRIADEGASLDAAYFCPAAPAASEADEHPDRKPSAGMLLRAAADLDLDLPRSWAVGDAPRDVEAGRRAGCRGILVGAEAGAGGLVAVDFTAAVDRILESSAEPV
jgi:D-glycero-D-manno-heptose 1,7-bisphosphate phosphatase